MSMKILLIMSIFVFLGIILVAMVMNVYFINGAQGTMTTDTEEYNTTTSYLDSLKAFARISPPAGTLFGVAAFVVLCVVAANYMIKWYKIE